MINVVIGIGSTGRICTDIAEKLDILGHEVKIAYGRGIVLEKFEKYAKKIGTDMDVNLHFLKSRLYDKSGFGSIRATKIFIDWLEEYNPDIIHLHNLQGYYINIDVLFKYLKKSNKRVIWTLHDSWPVTGHTSYCEYISCNRWENGCFDCPLFKEYPKTIIERSEHNWKQKNIIFNGLKNIKLVTPSLWLKNIIEKSYLRDYPIEVINNCIDTNKFRKNNKPNIYKSKWSDKFVILAVASVWDKMKGLEDYVKLSKLLNNEYLIVLVGINKTQFSILTENMYGIEKTNSLDELVEIYSSSSIYLNLSYAENYPTVNIEAMSCDLPVITYDTGGSPEIIRKYGGIVSDKGDIHKISKIIKDLYSGMRTIELKFNKVENDVETFVNKYLSIYQDNQ